MNCEQTREYLDSYVSNELLIETNHEMLCHLEGCQACAAEAETRAWLKSRLKAAVSRQFVPPRLEARIREKLEPRRTVAWWQPALLAAATAAVFVVIWAGSSRSALPALTDRSAQAAFIERICAEVGTPLRAGLRDHIHCSVFRHYPKDPPSREEMEKKLGPQYQGLLPLLETAAPAGYRCVLAHQCSYAERKYVHLTLRNGEKALSLVVTQKISGEGMAGMAAARLVSGISLYEAKAERYEVAAFEAGNSIAYVISEMSGKENLDLAAAIAPGVTRSLTVAAL